MLYTYFTEKLLGLEEVIVKNIEQNENFTNIFIEMNLKEHCCPSCGCKTRKIHDYRTQKIKDTSAFNKNVYLFLRKRRYICPHCGKKFYENVSFLPRYHRMTSRLVEYIIESLACECSFTSVAKRVNLSTSTVIRIFDCINYGKPKLPKVLSIDEFKGNTWGEKYQCIITDPENGIVLDILPKRYDSYLCQYFKDMNKSDVKFFVSDMWKVYADFADVFFKGANQIVDKYHYIRQVIWAFEDVRKSEQKKFNKSHRIYFKRSKALLTKRYDFLSDEQKQQVNVMLYTSPTLSSAHYLKEKFFELLSSDNSHTAKKLLFEWIEMAQESGIPKFVACAKTYTNWSKGILNSFDFSYTNGFTEGCNNKIKVLKRNAYGYRNFKRFRNRILHMFSHQKQKSSAAA